MPEPASLSYAYFVFFQPEEEDGSDASAIILTEVQRTSPDTRALEAPETKL